MVDCSFQTVFPLSSVEPNGGASIDRVGAGSGRNCGTLESNRLIRSARNGMTQQSSTFAFLPLPGAHLLRRLLDDPLLLLRSARWGRACSSTAANSITWPNGPQVGQRDLRQPRPYGPLHGVRHLPAPQPRLAEDGGPLRPPGIAAKVAAKLAGYDWNLIEPYWFSLRVHEVEPERVVSRIFPQRGFPCRRQGRSRTRPAHLSQRLGHREAASATTRSRPCFPATERSGFGIDPARLAAAGWSRAMAGGTEAPLPCRRET